MSSFCILLGRLLVWRMMRKLTRSTKPNTDLIYRASTYKLPTIFLMVKARFPNPLEGYVPVVSRIVGPRGVKILHYPLLLCFTGTLCIIFTLLSNSISPLGLLFWNPLKFQPSTKVIWTVAHCFFVVCFLTLYVFLKGIFSDLFIVFNAFTSF